jgi:putative Holliday junction resolvase
MFLGIDYGPKNIGLALSYGKIASPYKVLKAKNLILLIQKIKKICQSQKIEKIIIGLPEGILAKETKKFAHLIKEKTSLPTTFVDETLTSQESLQKTLEAKIPLKKRKTLSHAFAATLILQNYLDNNPRQTK